jgi:hypothetical protein
MASFVVHGPFEIDFENRRGGRTLVFDDFWSESSKANYLAEERGAVRNKALTPIYVGKATKTFKQETFNSTNRHKYHNGFSEYAKGKPLMYFVVHPTSRGQRTRSKSRRLKTSLYKRVSQKIRTYKTSKASSSHIGTSKVLSAVLPESVTMQRSVLALRPDVSDRRSPTKLAGAKYSQPVQKTPIIRASLGGIWGIPVQRGRMFPAHRVSATRDKEQYPFYADFDLVGTRDHVLYADGLSMNSYDEVERHFRDIIRFQALQIALNENWGAINWGRTSATSRDDLAHLEKYVQRFKDTRFKNRAVASCSSRSLSTGTLCSIIIRFQPIVQIFHLPVFNIMTPAPVLASTPENRGRKVHLYVYKQ